MKLLVLTLLLACGAALAQPTLAVDGREVPGLTLDLVPGISYAPATPYADALGASLSVDYGAGVAVLSLGSRVATLRTYLEAAEAAAASNALTVDGVQQGAPGAVFQDGKLYLPVSALAQAFGGYTSFLSARERVLVVMPRGRVTGFSRRAGDRSERLVIELDRQVPYQIFHNEPVSTLEIRFHRTEATRVDDLEDGRFFDRAALLEGRAATEIRVGLRQDAAYEVYTVPKGRGYELVVSLFEGDAESSASAPPPRIVIDPGHGGADRGQVAGAETESGLALQLARELAAELEARGYQVQLTREDDTPVPLASRSGMGVGADLFLSLHLHQRAGDPLGIYFLSEASDGVALDLAIRQNAEAEVRNSTDPLRRRLLLNLIPDLEVGRRYAMGLQGQLFNRAGVRVGDPQGAPLAVLAGAAGRGLLLELDPEATGGGDLATALAEAVEALLGGSGSEQ